MTQARLRYQINNFARERHRTVHVTFTSFICFVLGCSPWALYSKVFACFVLPTYFRVYELNKINHTASIERWKQAFPGCAAFVAYITPEVAAKVPPAEIAQTFNKPIYCEERMYCFTD